MTDQPAFEVVLNGVPIKIYADGRVDTAAFVGTVINRIPELIYRAKAEAALELLEKQRKSDESVGP